VRLFFEIPGASRACIERNAPQLTRTANHKDRHTGAAPDK
jgi:hypothetical protein